MLKEPTLESQLQLLSVRETLSDQRLNPTPSTGKARVARVIVASRYHPWNSQHLKFISPRADSVVGNASVPTFAGDPREWLFFADFYFKTIHHTSDGDFYRLTKLRELLSPEVRQLTDRYLPNDYDLALQRLQLEFGDPEVIGRAHTVKKITNFRRVFYTSNLYLCTGKLGLPH
jgi:Protein of unknown function (DUF1759)